MVVHGHKHGRMSEPMSRTKKVLLTVVVVGIMVGTGEVSHHLNEDPATSLIAPGGSTSTTTSTTIAPVAP
jgi:hypothetical protein